MSNVIDERVVEMKFDNKQFEENCSQTMTTLDKLKAALKLDGVANGFREVDAASREVKMEALGEAVETVSLKFNALEVMAFTALQNITNKAVDAGLKLAKSLSLDQVSAGFQKFGDKTQAVGTLISQGFDLDEVNEQLDLLNWFTDETSYNFVDMVNNIGKFTASGRTLDESVQSMMGIANWAALSGQNAQKASMAMYQLSQAMGKGALKYDDWKSIQNASMDTVEFREKAIEAAVAVGTLTEAGDGLYKMWGKGDLLSRNDLFVSEALTRGQWLSADVMIETFRDYAGAVNDIYETVQNSEEDLLASEAIEMMNGQLDEFQLKAFKAAQECRTWGDVVDATADATSTAWMNVFQQLFGDYEEAKALWSEIAEIGYNIFAAPIAGFADLLEEWNQWNGRYWLLKGFGEALEVIKSIIEPIKEGFMNIFPPITGRQLEKFTHGFYTLFKRLKLTEGAQNGLRVITEAFAVVLKVVLNVIKIGVNIFTTLFVVVWKVADAVLSFAGTIGEFVEGMVAAVKESDLFKSVMTTITGVINKVRSGFKYLVDNFSELGEKLGNMPGVQKLLATLTEIKDFLVDKIGDGINYILGLINNLGLAEFEMPTIDDLASAIDYVAGKLAEFIDWLDQTFTKLGQWIGGVWSNVSEFFKSLGIDTTLAGALEAISNGFDKVYESLVNIKNNAGDTLTNLTTAITNLVGDPAEIKEKVGAAAKAIGEAIGNFFDNVDAGKIASLVAIAGGITALVGLIDFIIRLKNAFKELGNIPKNVNGVLVEVKDTLKIYQQQLKANILWTIAKSIIVLAAAIFALSLIPTGTLTTVTSYLIILMLVLNLLVKTFNNRKLKDAPSFMKGFLNSVTDLFEGIKNAFSKAAKMAGIGILLVGIAAAIGILAKVIFSLVDLDWGDALHSIGIIAVIMALLVSVVLALSAITTKFEGGNKLGLKMAIAFIGIAAAVAIMSKVFQNLANMEGNIWVGIGAMGAITVFMIALGAIGSIAEPKSILAFSVMMILVGAAMAILARVVMSMEDVEWASLGKAGLMSGGLLIVLEVLVHVGKKQKELKTALGAMIVVTAIFVAIAYAVRLMDGVSWNTVFQSLFALLGVLGLLAGFSFVMKYVGEGFLTFGAAVAVMGIGLAAGGIAILAFAAAMALLSQYLVPFGQAILDFADLVGENGDKLAQAFYAIVKSIAVAIVTAAPYIMSAGIWLILAFCAALLEHLNDILDMLGYIFIKLCEWLGKAAKILGDVLLVLLIQVIDGFAWAIYNNTDALTQALENLGNALTYLIIDIATKIVDWVLNIIESMFPALKPKLDRAREDLQNFHDRNKEIFKPKEIETVGVDYANAFGDGVGSGLPAIFENFKKMFGLSTDAMEEVEPQLTAGQQHFNDMLANETITKETIGDIQERASEAVDAVADPFADAPALAGDAGSAVTEEFAEEMLSNSGLASDAASSITDSTLDELLDEVGFANAADLDVGAFNNVFQTGKVPGAIAMAKDVAKNVSDAELFKGAGNKATGYVASGILGNKKAATDAGASVGKASAKAAHNQAESEKSGENTDRGVAKGIRDYTYVAVAAAEELGRKVTAGYNRTQGIMSPSRVMMRSGRYTIEGLIIGMNQMRAKAVGTAEDLASGEIDAINGVIEHISDLIDGNLEYDPTIRPVLDVSGIQNGLDTVDDMLGRPRSLTAGILNGGYQSPTIEQQITTAVDKALDNIYDKIESAASKRPVTINVPLSIDKRQFARATATVTREELDRIDYFTNRKAGIA